MQSDSPRKASIVIANALAEMQKVVDFVERFGADYAVPHKALINLNVCLDELLSNTISYGYHDQAMHEITIELSLDGKKLRAEIRDDAAPFDPRSAKPEAAEQDSGAPKIGGLGLHFVKTLMDEVGYVRTERENVVTIAKQLQ
jgi:anti-sigma regulatory factor (Ser/Thr protein kinase)